VKGDTIMNHKDLDVWIKAMDLAENVYVLTRTFPKEEIYGLTSQSRRAVVSVPSNISEGAARTSRKEFLLFLGYALGSFAELETQLILAKRLSYFQKKMCLIKLIECELW
jgi:four helix bundle protein